MHARAPAVFLAVASVLFTSGPVAAAQLDAEYAIRVRGIPIGTARLALSADKSRFQVYGSGRVNGLMRIFSDGEATGTSHGSYVDQALSPDQYSHLWSEDGETEKVDIRFAGSGVSELSVDPRPKPRKNVVRLTDEHKQDVLDPLSALVIAASSSGGPAVCDRTLPILDGRHRFDLVLSFSRIEQVEGTAGSYAGPAFVCAIRYVPIAGHRPDKDSVRFMADNKDMEIWMAPIGDTGLHAPVTTRIRTRAGMLAIEAQRFAVN